MQQAPGGAGLLSGQLNANTELFTKMREFVKGEFAVSWDFPWPDIAESRTSSSGIFCKVQCDWEKVIIIPI